MSGFFSNSPTQATGIKFADSATIDAFGRVRVSQPYTIFDSKTLHDKQSLFWDEEINGTGSSVHVPEDALCLLSVINDGDFVIRQTKMRFNYQPGKSQAATFTGTLNPEDDVFKAIGLIDCQYAAPHNITDGIYFSAHDGYVAVNIAKAGRIITAPQSEWNTDKMDGTGTSNVNMDWSKAHIFTMDYEWLGAGRVRMGLYIDGIPHYCHQFSNYNVIEAPYISTPNLPAHYEIRSTGGAGSMKDICCTVQSESEINPNGVLDGYGTQGAVNNLDTGNTYALLGIRLQADRKDITIIPLSASFLATTSDAFIWYISYNPSINGTFDYYDLANAPVQGAKGNNGNTVTNLGRVIARGYVAQQIFAGNAGHRDLTNAVLPGVAIDGTADELVLMVEPLGDNLDIYASIGWREL